MIEKTKSYRLNVTVLESLLIHQQAAALVGDDGKVDKEAMDAYLQEYFGVPPGDGDVQLNVWCLDQFQRAQPPRLEEI